MNKNFKLQLAYKYIFKASNIFEAYFSILANIINEKDLFKIDDFQIKQIIKNRYELDLPISFVRQVLSYGVKEKCFKKTTANTYEVDSSKIFQFLNKTNDFDKKWDNLCNTFLKYCENKKFDFSYINIEDFIIHKISEFDENFDVEINFDITSDKAKTDYAWYSFVKDEGEKNTSTYSFIACLFLSDNIREMLFFTGESNNDFKNLNVYLDTPVIFSLLGMDDENRVTSNKLLLKQMIQNKCKVSVLDNDFEEIKAIINNAYFWSKSGDYDELKANNVARYFHSLSIDEKEALEYVEDLETKLNSLGITIKSTSYDMLSNQYQIEETKLTSMILNAYQLDKESLNDDKKTSIQTDVRSIVMIYRLREGKKSITIRGSKELLLTSNNVIANISKQYENSITHDSSFIPACISMDFFGTYLWLSSPMNLIEYKKKALLADCYNYLKPNRKMLDDYIVKIEKAKSANEITEEQFLTLRNSMYVRECLLDMTKGDYACFDSLNSNEIFEKIQNRYRMEYQNQIDKANEGRDAVIKEMDSFKKDLELKDQMNSRLLMENNNQKELITNFVDKKIKFWTAIVTGSISIIPFFVITIITALADHYFDNIATSNFDINLMAWAIFESIAFIFFGIIYNKIKNFIKIKVEKKISIKYKQNAKK